MLRIRAAVRSSAGKNVSTASYDSVISTGVPKIMVVDKEAQDVAAEPYLEGDRDHTPPIIAIAIDNRFMFKPLRSELSYQKIEYIPRSRHNPKILGVDDAEIIGDRITEVGPIPRNFFTQETERRIGELGASRVGFIVRDMLVHHAP
jgi:hypothetical protein